MGIDIKAKRSVVRGVKMYEIDEISALKEGELPLEYMGGYPHVYKTNQNFIRIQKSEFSRLSLVGGRTYTTTEMDKCLEIIRAAGDRLHEINARLARENEGWGGTHYWTI